MDEKKEDWSGVGILANEAEASLMVGFLRSHDIPARVVDRSFHQTPTGDEDLSDVEVAVPTSRLAEAQAALAKRETEFAESTEGAETVMTDEGPREIDPE